MRGKKKSVVIIGCGPGPITAPWCPNIAQQVLFGRFPLPRGLSSSLCKHVQEKYTTVVIDILLAFFFKWHCQIIRWMSPKQIIIRWMWCNIAYCFRYKKIIWLIFIAEKHLCWNQPNDSSNFLICKIVKEIILRWWIKQFDT